MFQRHYHPCWLIWTGPDGCCPLSLNWMCGCDERVINEHEHSGTSIIHFYLHSIIHDDLHRSLSWWQVSPIAPLASRAASVDTPIPSPYATDSRSFQLPITVPWHHGSNPLKQDWTVYRLKQDSLPLILSNVKLKWSVNYLRLPSNCQCLKIQLNALQVLTLPLCADGPQIT